jgi:hypothetical protein
MGAKVPQIANAAAFQLQNQSKYCSGLQRRYASKMLIQTLCLCTGYYCLLPQ